MSRVTSFHHPAKFSKKKIFTVTRAKKKENNIDNSVLPSFLAFDKIFDLTFNRIRRIYWTIIVIVSLAVTMWQVGIETYKYLQAPVATAVSVESLEILQFPSVTVCQRNTVFYSCVDNNLSQKNTPNATISKTEWEMEWSRCGIKKDAVHSKVPCTLAQNVTGCTADLKKKQEATEILWPTVFGQCCNLKLKHSFKNDPDRANKAHWTIKIDYDEITKKMREHGEIFYYNLVLREDSLPAPFSIFFNAERIMGDCRTQVFFSKKEYHYLNTTTNPCLTEAAGAEYKTRCLAKLLDKKINCKLPYMKYSKHGYCNTLSEYSRTKRKAQHFFELAAFDECEYYRPCRRVEYEIARTRLSPGSEFKMTLRIQSKVNEVVSEYYSYSLSALISDLAANVGFFLGVTFVGVMEIVEVFARRIVSRCY